MNNSRPVYKRQRFLLDFIRQINTSVSNADLQKLVFLLIMNSDNDYYDFVPYQYGPHSFQLAEDINTLANNGFLDVNETSVQAKVKEPNTTSFSIATERGNELLRRVYCEYPYYAINNEMIDSFFCDETIQMFSKEKAKYNLSDQTLFTIGYEGKSIEAFINLLIINDVRLICDDRKNPLSRKFGFSKNKLSHISETIGIKYLHVPELGIESEKRKLLKTNNDYDALFSEYESNISSFLPYLEDIYSMILSHNRVALLCYESDAAMCHRHIIRDQLLINYKMESKDI